MKQQCRARASGAQPRVGTAWSEKLAALGLWQRTLHPASRHDPPAWRPARVAAHAVLLILAEAVCFIAVFAGGVYCTVCIIAVSAVDTFVAGCIIAVFLGGVFVVRTVCIIVVFIGGIFVVRKPAANPYFWLFWYMATNEDIPHKGKARLSWPFPSSIPAEVPTEVQTIRDTLISPNWDGLERVRSWAWKQAGEAKTQSLGYALALAVGSLVPITCAWGTANRLKEFLVVELMVSLAVSRPRAAYWRGQFPKWLVRVARCMAPGTFEELMIAGSCFGYLMRQMLQGKLYKEGGVVYMLWSSAGVYSGKASMVRATGPGIAQRCAEHVRLLLRPGSRDSSKKRYVQHRRVLNTVNFMPILAMKSLTRVTAMESTLIAIEAPDLNLAEMREDMQRRGRGLKLPVRRCPRLRPPPRFRRPGSESQQPQACKLLDGSTTWARKVPSVWSSPLVINLAMKKEEKSLGPIKNLRA